MSCQPSACFPNETTQKKRLCLRTPELTYLKSATAVMIVSGLNLSTKIRIQRANMHCRKHHNYRPDRSQQMQRRVNCTSKQKESSNQQRNRTKVYNFKCQLLALKRKKNFLANILNCCFSCNCD